MKCSGLSKRMSLRVNDNSSPVGGAVETVKNYCFAGGCMPL